MEYHALRNGACHYCGVEPNLITLYCHKLGIKTPFITIDRMDNRAGYFVNNCVSCCFVCNRTKGNFLSAEDMVAIGQKYIRPKWERYREEVWDDFMTNIEDGAYL